MDRGIFNSEDPDYEGIELNNGYTIQETTRWGIDRSTKAIEVIKNGVLGIIIYDPTRDKKYSFDTTEGFSRTDTLEESFNYLIYGEFHWFFY